MAMDHTFAPAAEADEDDDGFDATAFARLEAKQILDAMGHLCRNLGRAGKQALIECIWMSSNDTEQAALDLPYLGATLNHEVVHARLEGDMVRRRARRAAARAVTAPPAGAETAMVVENHDPNGMTWEVVAAEEAPSSTPREAEQAHAVAIANTGSHSAPASTPLDAAASRARTSGIPRPVSASAGDPLLRSRRADAAGDAQTTRGERVARSVAGGASSQSAGGSRHPTEDVILAILMGALMRNRVGDSGRASGRRQGEDEDDDEEGGHFEED